MDNKLVEINGILYWVDKMIEYIQTNSIIRHGNNEYTSYKQSLLDFCRKYNVEEQYPALYKLLDFYYYRSSGYSVNMTEALNIRKAIVELKNAICPNSYEKIFISHREKDKKEVEAFVELLHAVGIPRPTASQKEGVIFCTSHPEGYIPNGKRNLDEIRDQINTDRHTFYILWYTDNYFESQACLNEAGAIWAMKKKYQEILSPSFDSNNIRGLLDKQPTWFSSNDKYRLNTFKEQLESMFSLDPITENSWEKARDIFLQQLNNEYSENAVVSV